MKGLLRSEAGIPGECFQVLELPAGSVCQGAAERAGFDEEEIVVFVLQKQRVLGVDEDVLGRRSYCNMQVIRLNLWR